MPHPIRLLSSLAALAAALLTAAAPAVAEGPPRAGTVANFTPIDPPGPAPAATLTGADGASFTLDSFKGRVVLLNLWATWCGPCVEEMASLDRLQAKLGGADFIVVALSEDFTGAATVSAFYRKHGIEKLGLYLDTKNELQGKLSIPGLPTTMILDREGRAVGALVGPAQWDAPEAVALIRYYIDAGG